MRFTYSPGADALYVELAAGERRVDRTEIVEDGLHVDFDQAGHILGIEILGASQHVPKEELARAESPVVWLTLAEAAAEALAMQDPVTAETLKKQAQAGRLPAEKRGRDWYVARHELVNYLENRTPGRPPTTRAPAPAVTPDPTPGAPPPKRRPRGAARG